MSDQDNEPNPPGGQPQCEGLITGPSVEEQIIETKHLRKDLDDVIQRLRKLPCCDELHNARHYTTNALMCLGMNLKRLGNSNPYPNSRDTSNTTVDPTDAGLWIYH